MSVGVLLRLGGVAGTGGGVLVLGLAGIVLWRIPALRQTLAVRLRLASERRWVDQAVRACSLANPFGRRPRIASLAHVPAGLRVRVRVPLGHHAGHLLKAAPSLEAALRVQEVRVTRELSDAAMAQMLVVVRDPLGVGPPLLWPWRDLANTSAWNPVPIGVDEDGDVIHMRLAEHNLLLGGEPGAGKSAVLNLLVAATALDPATTLTVFDGKQVELAAWEGCADRFCGPDMTRAAETFEALRAEMDRRYLGLHANRRRKIDPKSAALHVVVIDELAFYLRSGAKTERTAFADGLHDLVSRGRAAGMVVLAATQKPGHEVVPTWIRDLFSFRLALRCTTPEASDTVLGQGWAHEGYSASTIAGANRGVGFLLAEGSVPVKLRAFYLDDGEIAEVARRATVLRGQR
jgi:hypothetical protein